MLETLANPTTYKDLLNTIGKLSEWAEQAGTGSLPLNPPSSDLIARFQSALNEIQPQAATEKISPDLTPNYPKPQEVLGSCDFFKAETQTPKAEGINKVQETSQTSPPVGELTRTQEVNLQKGMQAIDTSMEGKETDTKYWLKTIQDLGNILAQEASKISPQDLLKAQHLVGLLKVHAETGRKVSEGISDTLEQLLDVQG
ncbi:MAG: hypothetical protein IJU40_00255 [Desulfovibrionaceae bacterium]|nr:hypothetical protein [Desulfovibrionaceae bacterium]